jgi:hypothetical protein
MFCNEALFEDCVSPRLVRCLRTNRSIASRDSGHLRSRVAPSGANVEDELIHPISRSTLSRPALSAPKYSRARCSAIGPSNVVT